MMNELAPGTFQGLAPEEVALFQKHLKGVSGVGVEIGCLDGFSSRVILEASELHLTSIDPFIPDSMEASLIGSKERYYENVGPFGSRAGVVQDYSHQVIKDKSVVHFPFMGVLNTSRAIDFLFIDGDHRYEEVLRDFTDWTPLIKTGGLLAIHDARMSREGGAPFHPGPSRVAQERIFSRPDEWTVIGEAFSLVIARKR